MTDIEEVDLEFKDFAGDWHVIPKTTVGKVVLDQGRVWVTLSSAMWHRQIEVKNIQTVADWGRLTGKLENLDEE